MTQNFLSDEIRIQTSSAIPGEFCITFKALSSIIIRGMSSIQIRKHDFSCIFCFEMIADLHEVVRK